MQDEIEDIAEENLNLKECQNEVDQPSSSLSLEKEIKKLRKHNLFLAKRVDVTHATEHCIVASVSKKGDESLVKTVSSLTKERDQLLIDLATCEIIGEWQTTVRDALLDVGISPFNGFTYDHKYGTKVGGTIFEENGRRHSRCRALASNPVTLDVLVQATVQRTTFNIEGIHLYRHKKKQTRGFKKFQGQSLIQTVGITKKGVYIEASNGFGQSTSSILRHHGIASAEIGQLSTIPPRLRTHKAIQDYKNRKQDLPFEVFNGGFILGKIARPRSIGHLKLIDTNVDNNPAVTFNYFSHPHDLRKCVESIRIIEKLVKSKHFVDYTGTDEEITQKLLNMSVQANVNLIPKQTNDTQSLEQFCKDTVITIWHYHGGCQVGRVVNHDYRVLGVDRVRVIDGSTFTESPGTNPQATVMMMGRYMGVKILRERLGKGANV
ncbi:protein HOTHEAD-like [Silene latifolia]|uniref:protein HOTHEAD-like n=1 Tax=Silene latifolia TaxID=37657 RepID=UPI003D76EB32